MPQPMRILVTGVSGQLGHDVVNELVKRGHMPVASGQDSAYSGISDGSPVTTVPYVQADLADSAQLDAIMRKLSPDAVIHCAAWTAVDKAEEPDLRQQVFAVNAKGTETLAKAAHTCGAKFLYLSTDYVFNGQGTKPWDADSQEFAPLNVYGESKLAGEMAVRAHVARHFIVRIAWVFGMNGKNFIRTMLAVGKKHPVVRVVNDQVGTPTYTLDLARLLADMIETEKYGTYHATNEGGYISWYDFCCEIFRQAGYSTTVVPVSTAEYGLSKANRPFNSRLDRSKLQAMGFRPLPDWKDALARYLKEIENE